MSHIEKWKISLEIAVSLSSSECDRCDVTELMRLDESQLKHYKKAHFINQHSLSEAPNVLVLAGFIHLHNRPPNYSLLYISNLSP